MKKKFNGEHGFRIITGDGEIDINVIDLDYNEESKKITLFVLHNPDKTHFIEMYRSGDTYFIMKYCAFVEHRGKDIGVAFSAFLYKLINYELRVNKGCQLIEKIELEKIGGDIFGFGKEFIDKYENDIRYEMKIIKTNKEYS